MEVPVAWLDWWSEFILGFSLRILAVPHPMGIGSLWDSVPRAVGSLISQLRCTKTPLGRSMRSFSGAKGLLWAQSGNQFWVERVGRVFYIQHRKGSAWFAQELELLLQRGWKKMDVCEICWVPGASGVCLRQGDAEFGGQCPFLPQSGLQGKEKL